MPSWAVRRQQRPPRRTNRLERLGPPARRHCPHGRRHSRPRRQNEREEQAARTLPSRPTRSPSRPRSSPKRARSHEAATTRENPGGYDPGAGRPGGTVVSFLCRRQPIGRPVDGRSDQVQQRDSGEAEAASGRRPRRQTPGRLAATRPACGTVAGRVGSIRTGSAAWPRASTFAIQRWSPTTPAHTATNSRESRSAPAPGPELGNMVRVHVRILFGRLPPPDPQDGRQTDPEFPRVGRESSRSRPSRSPRPSPRTSFRTSFPRTPGTGCSSPNCRTIAIRSCRETSSRAYVRPVPALLRRDAKKQSTWPNLPL